VAEAPPGASHWFLLSQNRLLPVKTSRFVLPDLSCPIERFNSFANYKEKYYMDTNIVHYLSHFERQFAEHIELDKIVSGEKELPYAQSVFTEKAWQQGLKKYFPVRPKLSSVQLSKLDEAFSFLYRHFGPFMRNSCVLSHDEAVQSLRPTTSTGFPFSFKYSKKRDFYSSPEGFKYLYDFWYETSHFNGPKTYFKAALKDEIRPIEKIKLDKTRAFCAGPIENSYMCQRLFGHQRQLMKDSLFKTASCIGIRSIRLDFHRLWLRWSSFPNLFCLDAENWDGNVIAELIAGVALFRWNMLEVRAKTYQNWCRICNLYRDLIFKNVVFPDGHVFRSNGGMGSGHGLTAEDNTLIHYVVMAYCWVSSCDLSYDIFEENVIMSLYGDDSVVASSALVSPFWNVDSVIAYSAEIGVIYKPAQCSWDNIPFLGHRIVPYNYQGRVYHVGVLDAISVFSRWVLDGDGTWQMAVERSLALRMSAFLTPWLFAVIDGFVSHTLMKYDPKRTSSFWSSFHCEDVLFQMYFES
jgi:hypothetical protein